MNGDGLLQISSDETSGSFAVIATSVQDSSVTDSAIVTISAVDHYVYVGANPSEGGAVAGGGAVKDGGSCTISASPNNNFNFEGWYEGKALISNARQVTISNIKEDRNIEAVFSRNTCYVRTSVNIGGRWEPLQTVPAYLMAER
ncbi:InlB B-repeat-containing protein [Butyrivibrio sp. FCS014]|uniref:InlB B-repeat-containing protein n=1 Tax=Butyrivibrio sp. FCS014 TaxID=1408304 RepID=UPI003FA44643